MNEKLTKKLLIWAFTPTILFHVGLICANFLSPLSIGTVAQLTANFIGSYRMVSSYWLTLVLAIWLILLVLAVDSLKKITPPVFSLHLLIYGFAGIFVLVATGFVTKNHFYSLLSANIAVGLISGILLPVTVFPAAFITAIFCSLYVACVAVFTSQFEPVFLISIGPLCILSNLAAALLTLPLTRGRLTLTANQVERIKVALGGKSAREVKIYYFAWHHLRKMSRVEVIMPDGEIKCVCVCTKCGFYRYTDREPHYGIRWVVKGRIPCFV